MNGGRCVFMVAGAFMARLLTPLARRLRERHGLGTVLLALREDKLPNAQRYGFDRGAFEEILFFDPLLAPRAEADVPPLAALAEQAAELERRLGVNVLEVIRSDRHIGVGFVASADFHGSAYARGMDYRRSVDLALRLCAFAERLVAERRPLCVIGYPGTVYTSALIGVAEALGVPMRALGAPRRANFFYWCADREGWPVGLAEAYAEELRRAPAAAPAPTSSADPVRTRLLRERIARGASLAALARANWKQFRGNIGVVLRGRGGLYGNYAIRDKMRAVTGQWLARRRALAQAPVLPTLPPDLPFVFFPLHMEPESSLMVEARRAPSQATAIDWLARGVPPGWCVVVKEHPAQGVPRSHGFLDLLRRYPNLIACGMLEQADEIAARAQAVAIINGTVGFQAATAGKPVISFYERYIPNLLPHVRYVRSFEEVMTALRDVRDGRLPPMQERLAAAAALDRALGRAEFPINHGEMLAGVPAQTPIADAEVDLILESLLGSLAAETPDRRAAAL